MKMVTGQNVDDEVKSVEYHVFGNGRTTVCLVTMQNGFGVVGQSSCIDPANFNELFGQSLALKDAKNQIWTLLGFRGRDEMYNEEHGPDTLGEDQ